MPRYDFAAVMVPPVVPVSMAYNRFSFGVPGTAD